MDPNATLNEILDLAQRISEDKPSDISAGRLAELVLALDDWMRRGGFVPRRWEWWKDKEGGTSR